MTCLKEREPTRRAAIRRTPQRRRRKVRATKGEKNQAVDSNLHLSQQCLRSRQQVHLLLVDQIRRCKTAVLSVKQKLVMSTMQLCGKRCSSAMRGVLACIKDACRAVRAARRRW